MCCSPLIEVSTGVVYWGGESINISDYIIANFVVIIFTMVYGFTYIIFNKVKFNFEKWEQFDYKFNRIINDNQVVYLLVTLTIILFVTQAIWNYNNYDFISMIVRGGSNFERAKLSQTSWLIYMYFIRPMLIILLLVYASREKGSKFIFMLLLVLVLIHTSPFSMARFYFVALYLPLFVVYTNLFSFRFSFSIYFIFGLLFLFPFLDKFRHFSSEDDFNWQVDFSFLTVGHFDAYQNFSRVIESEFYTWGHQLLGALFFFIPRSIWEDKPVGSGVVLAKLEHLSFSNISMPLIAESYINFHLVGILIVPIIVAFLSAYFDNFYWGSNNKKGVTKLFYLFSLGLFLFVLRGDLTSSFSYSIALFLSLLTVISIYYFFSKFPLKIFR